MYDAFGLDKHLLVVKPFVAFFGKLFARRKSPAFTLESISTHSVATNPKGVRQQCARSNAANPMGARWIHQFRMQCVFGHSAKNRFPRKSKSFTTCGHSAKNMFPMFGVFC